MILGVDPGRRWVGVALADEETRFARPLEVIDETERDAAARIAELVAEHGVETVVIGRPVSLSGAEGPAVRRQKGFLDRVRAAVGVEVVEHDERMTTVLAERGLRAGGASRTTRAGLKDAVAAQLMLQGYLDSKRS